jgi:signal transduction histidine kinase
MSNADPGVAAPVAVESGRASGSWLARVPVADAVDRRNAPMLQIVLLLLASLPPLMWAYRIFLSPLPWRAGEAASLAMSLFLSAIAVVSFVLIRRGRFRPATRLLLGVVMLLMLLSYADAGYSAQEYERPVQAVWIVLAGLIVGRRALWSMYFCLMLAFALGVAVDIASGKNQDAWSDQIMSATIAAVIFLLVAVVVDRSVSALRESLAEATRRGDELEHVNRRLEAEIVERERVKEQLVHAQKVEAVGRLAGGVAHDFNHLLNLMLGYAQRGRSTSDIDTAKAALGGVESAVQRAAAIVQTLLNFSRREPARREIFDVAAALVEMRPMLQQSFDSSVRLRFDIAEGVHRIAFDRTQFTLIVLNVASNASHAMPDGGEFRVALHGSVGDDVVIEFADDGQGIGADVLPHIFEPFFTTKPRGKGTGLGLAVARNLVEEAAGRMDAQSEPGRGTRLRLWLPRASRADSLQEGGSMTAAVA